MRQGPRSDGDAARSRPDGCASFVSAWRSRRHPADRRRHTAHRRRSTHHGQAPHGRRRGPALDLLAVVNDDLHPPGDDGGRLRGLAAVGSGDRPHVLGPLPVSHRRPRRSRRIQHQGCPRARDSNTSSGSPRRGRLVHIHGETLHGGDPEHPAFRNLVATYAALYDMQHDPALRDTMTYESPLAASASEPRSSCRAPPTTSPRRRDDEDRGPTAASARSGAPATTSTAR